MSSGARTAQATNAAQVNAQLAQQFTGVGLGAIHDRNQMINAALGDSVTPSRGMPSLAGGFNAQRAALSERAYRQEENALEGLLMQAKAPVGGGNYQQVMQSPGSSLPGQLAQSRLNEGMAQVEQQQKLLAMALGQNVDTASQAIGAGANQIRMAGMLPDYNPALAWGAGLGSAAYAAYQGWPRGQQQQPASGPYGLAPGINPSRTTMHW